VEIDGLGMEATSTVSVFVVSWLGLDWEDFWVKE
jgi:hypothetical protein